MYYCRIHTLSLKLKGYISIFEAVINEVLVNCKYVSQVVFGQVCPFRCKQLPTQKLGYTFQQKSLIATAALEVFM